LAARRGVAVSGAGVNREEAVPPIMSSPGDDYRHQREALVLHEAIERSEVFDLLPRTLTSGSNQQQERLGFRHFLGEFGQPEARTQRDREKETCAVGSIPHRPARTASARAVSLELNDRNIRTLMPSSELRALPEQSLSLMALKWHPDGVPVG